MADSLDDVDLRIMAELSKNARTSHANLGKVVHLSRNAVRARIERMERSGRIAGYTVIQRAPEAEQDVVAALIFVYRVDRLRGKDVLEFLRSMPEVKSCNVMSGELDIVARVEASRVDRIREIWELVARHKGVKDTSTSFVLS